MKKFYAENPPIRKIFEYETRVCKCGCNAEFSFRKDKHKEYLHGHIPAIKKEEANKKRASSIKNYINNLSKEEKVDRIKKSFGNRDEIKRGKNISASKKGKSTNQVQIMSSKFYYMNDEDFSIFL